MIHSASDLQIEHLFPAILKKDLRVAWSTDEWTQASKEPRRSVNLEWFDRFLGSLPPYDGSGIMVGLLDAFRADHQDLLNAVATVERNGFTQVRLVDTAGACLPHQVSRTVGETVSSFPKLRFYGHFHDDFGMATGNAIVGLSLGLHGVDVSVGGFANRAGHSPLGEVVMALRKLYGMELAGFRYEQLCALSRSERAPVRADGEPCAGGPGIVTHAIQLEARRFVLLPRGTERAMVTRAAADLDVLCSSGAVCAEPAS